MVLIFRPHITHNTLSPGYDIYCVRRNNTATGSQQRRWCGPQHRNSTASSFWGARCAATALLLLRLLLLWKQAPPLDTGQLR